MILLQKCTSIQRFTCYSILERSYTVHTFIEPRLCGCFLAISNKTSSVNFCFIITQVVAGLLLAGLIGSVIAIQITKSNPSDITLLSERISNLKETHINDTGLIDSSLVVVVEPIHTISNVTNIQDALDSLKDILADQCILELSGTYELGDNPVLDFFPAVRNCKTLILRGVRENVISDTVASTEIIEPATYSWTRIYGTVGNYPNGTYAAKYIENTNQGRVYAIDVNSETYIDTIAGAAQFSTSDVEGSSTPPLPIQKDAW